MRTRAILFPLLAGAALLTRSAWAHPGHAAHDFSSGVAHPIFGLDHLLAMLAVGLWAVQLGGRALWAVPCTFVGVMALGGACGMNGLELPAVESGIAVSVLLLGLLIAGAFKLPLYVSAGLTAAFAFCHGCAHGAELPAGASGLAFAGGFVVATALLHGAGIGLAVALRKTQLPQSVLRGAGAAIAVAGVALLVNVLAGA